MLNERCLLFNTFWPRIFHNCIIELVIPVRNNCEQYEVSSRQYYFYVFTWSQVCLTLKPMPFLSGNNFTSYSLLCVYRTSIFCYGSHVSKSYWYVAISGRFLVWCSDSAFTIYCRRQCSLPLPWAVMNKCSMVQQRLQGSQEAGHQTQQVSVAGTDILTSPLSPQTKYF